MKLPEIHWVDAEHLLGTFTGPKMCIDVFDLTHLQVVCWDATTRLLVDVKFLLNLWESFTLAAHTQMAYSPSVLDVEHTLTRYHTKPILLNLAIDISPYLYPTNWIGPALLLMRPDLVIETPKSKNCLDYFTYHLISFYQSFMLM